MSPSPKGGSEPCEPSPGASAPTPPHARGRDRTEPPGAAAVARQSAGLSITTCRRAGGARGEGRIISIALSNHYYYQQSHCYDHVLKHTYWQRLQGGGGPARDGGAREATTRRGSGDSSHARIAGIGPAEGQCRGRRLHTRNRHLRNHRGLSVAFSNGLSVALSNRT